MKLKNKNENFKNYKSLCIFTHKFLFKIMYIKRYRNKIILCNWYNAVFGDRISKWKSLEHRQYGGRSFSSTLPRQLDKFNLRGHCFRRTVKQERSLSSHLLFAWHFEQRVLHSRHNKARQFIDSSTIVFLNEKNCMVKYTW